MNPMLRTTSLALGGLLITAGAVSQVDAAEITNPWSGVAGDRANYTSYQFQATAGTYPTSVTPAGALEDPVQVFSLDSLTFTRPANDDPNSNTNTPQVGEAAGQLTSLATPVYVDVYTTRGTGNAYSGYVGSSTSSVVFGDFADADRIEPGEEYTFTFSGIELDKDTPYWFVFSETNTDGDVTNFRTRVNTSATAAGADYLATSAQVVNQAGSEFNWGVEYVASVTPIPEPTSLALVGLGGLGLLRRRRA